MRNHKLHQIETGYDPENDTPRDGPAVTWAEKALFDEVLQLLERVTTLETAYVIGEAPIPAAITVDVLAKSFVAKDANRSCPFCGKDEWQQEGESKHDAECPFTLAYQVLTPEAEEVIESEGEIKHDVEWDRGKLLNAVASAIEMAHSLNIDDAVREVAKSGKRSFGSNWYAEWGNFEISASFGAGINSASASIELSAGYQGSDPVVVYRASENGRYVETFRTGLWVNRFLAHADELRQANKIKDRERNAEEDAGKLGDFEVVDF